MTHNNNAYQYREVPVNKLDLTDNRNRILPKMLAMQAEQAGNAEYLITDERRLTFAQVDEESNRIAAGLRLLGVERGDRVCFYLDSGIETVLLAMATNKLGAIWVPINADYKGSWLSETIERSRAKVLVTEVSMQDRVQAVQDSLHGEKLVVLGPDEQITLPGAISFAALEDHEPITPNYDDMDYGDTCAVLWTSGTTGKSKGVLQSHNCWVRPIAQAASIYFNSRDGDVIYNVLPLYNSGAWITAVIRALYEGLPVVLEKRFSVTTFWDRIRHFGATQTFTLGAMHHFLWNAPPSDNDRDNPLRIAQMVPMPEQLLKPFSERFDVELLPMGLGQSEAMLIFTPVNCMGKVPFSSLGLPLDDTEVVLLGDDGNPVKDGEVGEICMKCLQPNLIFNGYFDDADATAEAFKDGWYHTGDMGKRDPESGAYWFVDRKKDALRYAGRNISTMEVEMVLRRHPMVKDVAAFGIPSEDVKGESLLKLNVVLKPDANITYEQMAEYINDNAPYYFVPQYMEFVEALPYTPTNKVQKFKLREEGVTDKAWVLKESGYKVKR
ncbi:AMP-binding protein [Ketobacter alkanivorans]|uniref:AMP-binding protein n=1 Tax=Ketobacter alkanivorans TaxID=1917421 RepID=A0A2K9LJD5_9GAMM|nr:AMP-binding protein [Ketobacter alkanivorans]AUM12350.1 AMP-binding protein [Ketobacter alkanivorans]